MLTNGLRNGRKISVATTDNGQGAVTSRVGGAMMQRLGLRIWLASVLCVAGAGIAQAQTTSGSSTGNSTGTGTGSGTGTSNTGSNSATGVGTGASRVGSTNAGGSPFAGQAAAGFANQAL